MKLKKFVVPRDCMDQIFCSFHPVVASNGDDAPWRGWPIVTSLLVMRMPQLALQNLRFNQQVGLQSLLKDGGKHFSGVDEALLKNIEACKNLAQITKSSLGPYGMNKLIVNHLGKHFVTSDTNTIVTELEVMHPAAKLIVMAAKSQARASKA